MSILRLVADDLTGALDAGAQFTGSLGPIPCSLGPRGDWPAGESLAVNMACRDGSELAAVAAARATLPVFQGADIAFKKIDSLLRGHWAAELAACAEAFPTIVLAPAFPAQNRVTRDGRQWARFPGRDWTMVEVDPAEALAARGLNGERLGPGTMRFANQTGMLICDAETEEDLSRLVAALSEAPGPVLWCGSAGLARALAGMPPRRLEIGGKSRLAIVGTDNAVTLGQVELLRRTEPRLVVTFDHDAAASAARIAATLTEYGACLASADLPAETDRGAAAGLIAGWLGDVFGRLSAPKHLAVSGGETFLALCRGLAVDHLLLLGEWTPGLPLSRLVGGPWGGAHALSKSGAFGDEAVFTRMLLGS